MNQQGGALTSWGPGHPVPRHTLLLVCLISGAGSANPRAEIFHLLELIILSSDYFSSKEKTRATAMQTPAPSVWKIWWRHWGLWHTSGPDVLGCLSGFFVCLPLRPLSEIVFLNLHISSKPKLISQFTSTALSSRTRLICGKKQLSPQQRDLKGRKAPAPYMGWPVWLGVCSMDSCCETQRL